MNKNHKNSEVEKPTLPRNSINANLTAKPDTGMSGQVMVDADSATNNMEYGEASLEDAKESGYTDKNGKAVSMAKPDVAGLPTGAYTDVGAGRSSAVHRSDENKH